MDIATFRTTYPEFKDSGLYTDAAITYWIGIAGFMLNTTRWADLLDLGIGLFVAHHVVLEKMIQDTANLPMTNWPGLNKGVISSEGGQISLSYDTGATSLKDIGHWNYTTFGTRFKLLSWMVGAGPVQVGSTHSGTFGPYPGVIPTEF